MSRRDQPYIPLYAQDFLTDEKLRECSAASVGVYIMLMCVMHKQEEYGTILLREKDRKSEDIIQDFSRKLAKHLPFGVEVIGDALRELLDEDVIQLEGDRISQKRMVKDADVSEKRSSAGRKGSTATNAKFAAAKGAANDPAKGGATKEDGPEDGELPSPTAEGGRNVPRGTFDEVAALYNEICTSFPRIRSLSEARRKAIRARMANGYTVESFRELFQKAQASSFLKGNNERNWQATFDWMIKDSNMAKVIDGNYEDKGGSGYGTYEDRGRNGGFTADPAQFRPSTGFSSGGEG